MDWNSFPKVLADKMHLSFGQLFFTFGFESGSEKKAYMIAPATAKGLIQGLTDKVNEYEAKFGKIDMNGFESGIESPIQIQ